MPLDSHVKRLLHMVAAAGVPDISQLSPAQMRQTITGLSDILDIKDVAIGRIDDRELPGPGGPLAIRTYTPLARESEQKLAALVYFHGGCFVFCDLNTHDGICRMLANESGCRVISVDYRLAPEHKFPAAVEDAFAATKWVAEHALELRIDPCRIAVAGDSAGANLASVVCQLAKKTGGPDLVLQVLFCPAMEVRIDTPTRRAFGKGYFLDEATLDWAFKHCCDPDTDLNDPRLFPLRATSFLGFPPAHIHTAEFDPLRDEAQHYADRLKEAGVPVLYMCHKGMIHHFYCMAGAIPYARTAIKAAGAEIKNVLS
jgi:acetyl esterase